MFAFVPQTGNAMGTKIMLALLTLRSWCWSRGAWPTGVPGAGHRARGPQGSPGLVTGRLAHSGWPAFWEHTFVNEEAVALRDSQGCFLLGHPAGSQAASTTGLVVLTGLLEVGDLSQNSLGAEANPNSLSSQTTGACIPLGRALPGPGSGSGSGSVWVSYLCE